jgi:hypothetical protein
VTFKNHALPSYTIKPTSDSFMASPTLLIIIAWVLVVLDALLAVGLALATGVLSSIFLSSHVTSDKQIGAVMMLVALVLLAHPALGGWWAWSGSHLWALIYAGCASALTAGLLYLVISSIEPAARP